MTLKKLFRRNLLPFLYEKKASGSSLYSVEKRKYLKVTLLKREKTNAFVRTHYLKFICSTRFLPSQEPLSAIREDDFGRLDVPVEWEEPLLVSIIVPNYNHARYLKERLDSIYNQTYRHFEVILLDDCSTDGSVEVLKEYARKYPENILSELKARAGRVYALDAAAEAEAAGSLKSVNVFMIGALAKVLGVDIADAEAALKAAVKPKFYDINRIALGRGYACDCEEKI